ncbi:glycosyltransferase [Falsiroseomonas sp.]|uniref:glycosyltransferase n=1 Tax=Falsiroseomonas sp. TaxID=2870721 RepID=UPI00356875E8
MSTLDIILPSFNRAASLRRAVESLFGCRRPAGLQIRIIVVDNNSTDSTRQVVAHLAASGMLPVHYLFEARQGKPIAINAGIAASEGELIAFFDDDERAFPDWLEVIATAFSDPALGFITGRYVPDWLVPPPAWLPATRMGLVGVVDYGEHANDFVSLSDGLVFLGGNAVARRQAVLATGGYSEWLTYGDDAEFGLKLMRAGMAGRYVPALRVHHEIPASRLTRAYLRRRAMMNHAAKVRIRQRWPELDQLTFGFPVRLAYYRLLALLSAMPALAGRRVDPAERFEAELLFWDLWGMLSGWFSSSNDRLMR